MTVRLTAEFSSVRVENKKQWNIFFDVLTEKVLPTCITPSENLCKNKSETGIFNKQKLSKFSPTESSPKVYLKQKERGLTWKM